MRHLFFSLILMLPGLAFAGDCVVKTCPHGTCVCHVARRDLSRCWAIMEQCQLDSKCLRAGGSMAECAHKAKSFNN